MTVPYRMRMMIPGHAVVYSDMVFWIPFSKIKILIWNVNRTLGHICQAKRLGIPPFLFCSVDFNIASFNLHKEPKLHGILCQLLSKLLEKLYAVTRYWKINRNYKEQEVAKPKIRNEVRDSNKVRKSFFFLSIFIGWSRVVCSNYNILTVWQMDAKSHGHLLADEDFSVRIIEERRRAQESSGEFK